jgi:hypothetical protein
MNIRHLRGKITGSLLVFSILFGVALASSTTAQAQYPNGRDRYERRRDRDIRDRDDREREWRRNRNWDRNRDRRNDRYSRNDGYNNGRYGTYGGYDNNGRYGGYNNQAEINQGYQAGLNTGASDAQRGQSFNPQRSHLCRAITKAIASMLAMETAATAEATRAVMSETSWAVSLADPSTSEVK